MTLDAAWAEMERYASTEPGLVATAVPATTATTRPTATSAPTTATTSVYYANCDAVKAAGKAPLHRGDPGYRSGLDRDGDGIACET